MGRYGLDKYSRYFEDDDGEQYVIEPWPINISWRYRLNLLRRIQARINIVRWYWGTRKQRDLWKY